MAPPKSTPCAGSAALCSKRYDQVTFLAAHNAYAIEGKFQDPDQAKTIPELLALGVRGFLIDTWIDDTQSSKKELALCHSKCRNGKLPLVATLKEYKKFLHTHRGDIVTLIVEDDGPNDLLMAAFKAAGLEAMMVAHQRGAPWPTLGEMVAKNQRLVVFVENNQGDACTGASIEQGADNAFRKVCGPRGAQRFEKLHVAYDEMWDTPYGVVPDAGATQQCPVLRGDPKNPLMLMNHFKTKFWDSRDARQTVSATAKARIAHCRAEGVRSPNFIALDWIAATPESTNAFADLKIFVDALNRAPAQ